MAEKVWFSGTFSNNPLTIAVADAVAQRLLEAGEGLQVGLNERAARRANGRSPPPQNHGQSRLRSMRNVATNGK